MAAGGKYIYPGWAAELSAWAPPADITVSQWAAQSRILPKSSAIPGRWNHDLVPYAAGVMDAFNSPWVERITIMASVQSSKTESVYNMLGYAICQDPAPAVIVMPTLNTMKRVNRRIRRMITGSEELASHLTGNPDDMQMHQLILDRCDVYFATAGSDADLQNVEARYVICDETDEYPFTEEQGDLVEKAVDRSTTYWNRKIVVLSRPTATDGYINRSFEDSEQHLFWVPCPVCGHYQVLSFSRVVHAGYGPGEWPKDRRGADYIRQNRVARYSCRHCGHEIDDKDKPQMLKNGIWARACRCEDCRAAKIPDRLPINHDFSRENLRQADGAASHVGFWWSVLYSPFRTFSEVASQYWKVKDYPEKLRIFINQWLAEPWHEIIKSKTADAIMQLRTSRPALVVPDGTVALTAGVDNQRRGLYCSIWAWVRLESGLFEQHLVRYGYLADFVELEIWLFQDIYSTASGAMTYPVWRAGIDTGGGEGEAGDPGLTEQVYTWLRLRGQGRVFGVKGSSTTLPGGKKLRLSVIDKMPGKGQAIPGGLRLWLLDTNALKDAFWSRAEAGQVQFHDDIDDDWARQLISEVKERDRRGKLRWVQQPGRANHYLDTAIYASAMADPECWGGVMVLPAVAQPGAALKQVETDTNPLTGRARGSWLGR